MSLPLIVKFEVKEEKLDEFKRDITKILEPTRKEEGCILYELHQDLDDPCVFMFYEIWETVDAWKKHDETEHILKFKEVVDDYVNNITFNKLKVI